MRVLERGGRGSSRRGKLAAGEVGALRIAVVGCGAIGHAFHVPALAAIPGVGERVVLVDSNLSRANALRQEFGSGAVCSDHREVIDDVDGAIVAVPPEHHASVAGDFLAAGIPVLCEKPLATSIADGAALVEVGRRSGALLGVNQVRRLFPAVRRAAEWIGSGSSGTVRRIEIHEGAPFDWPLTSGGTFGRDGCGRGVLQDLGAHALDMVCWWLGSRPAITRYMDDSMGGSESVARVEFEGEGVEGVVQMSWLSRLSNTFRIEGEDERLEGEIRAWDSLWVTKRGGRARKLGLEPAVSSYPRVKGRMIENFLDAIRGHGTLEVPAEEVLPSLDMIEECYRRRGRFPMPWHEAGKEVCDEVG